MISLNDLSRLSRGRLADSKVLFKAGRYDGAAYLAGYAIEIALKLRICKTLKWIGFPETAREFENYGTLKTHKLDVLLHLSGFEKQIKSNYLSEWSVVTSWDPEARYRPIGSAKKSDIQLMILSAQMLIKIL
jgi:hypothetical protein